MSSCTTMGCSWKHLGAGMDRAWIGYGSGYGSKSNEFLENPCAAGSTLQQHESWKDNRPVTNQRGWNCLHGRRVWATQVSKNTEGSSNPSSGSHTPPAGPWHAASKCLQALDYIWLSSTALTCKESASHTLQEQVPCFRGDGRIRRQQVSSITHPGFPLLRWLARSLHHRRCKNKWDASGGRVGFPNGCKSQDGNNNYKMKNIINHR